MKNFIFTAMVLCNIMLMSSCYLYDGPTHAPYVKQAPLLPPPPAKIYAKPDSKAEYLQKTFNEIKGSLPEADVVMIEDSIKVLFPNNITYNSKDILPSSAYQEPLKTFAVLLNKYKKTDILITGHSDSRGIEQKNKELSEIRSFNIKKVLIEDGVSSSRLQTWGLGSVSPIADNATEEGRMKNRRVEFVVLYRD